MNRLLQSAMLVVVLGAGPAVPDEPTDVPLFFVAPLTTDVHREMIARNASAYAVVNCSDVLTDDQLDRAKLNEAQFVTELKQAAERDPSRLKLVMRYQFTGTEIAESAKKELRQEVTELARTAGFQDVSATEMSTSAAWADSYLPAQRFDEPDAATEPIVEDDFARIYPLRTRLSRLVIGDAGCVVEVKQAIDGRRSDLSGELQASVRQQIDSLDFGPDKGVLMFKVMSTDAGYELVNQLFDSRTDSPAKQLASSLGFTDITYSHSPCGGAPEKLIGQPAPNFKLQTLEGEELELSTHLNGRPGLVTFWGVACGPCRREAPHLTAMHAKYGDAFAIVAVNAYTETRETVAKYAEEAKLTHPIVIGGQSVATDQYHVAAYPLTFWVNREGIVEDYELDFDSAAALERRIQARLKD